MNKEENAIKADTSTVATKEGTPVVVPTEIDYEAQISALEAEKATLIGNEANYKLALLKERKKNKGLNPEEEDEDERISRMVDEKIASSRLADIAKQERELRDRAFRENKELKQALMNRQNGIPTSIGTHTEGKKVSDTLVTPQQEEAFRKAGWNDKTIERYKKNLLKNAR